MASDTRDLLHIEDNKNDDLNIGSDQLQKGSQSLIDGDLEYLAMPMQHNSNELVNPI